MADNVYYEDLSIDPVITSTGDISTVKNLDSIKQSIRLLVNTPKGSRMFNPDYGCRIKGFLLEPFDETTGKRIGLEIQETLTNYEKRINLLSVNVTMNWTDLSYNVSIVYNLINTQYTDTANVSLDKL